MKLRHLEVFNALIEAGSVSRAAEKLGLSQPAVSIALSNLESELDLRLFHRSKGYFMPTSEAKELHFEVEQGLLAMSRIRKRAEDVRSGRAGNVSIATNGALAINFLPMIVAEFQRKNPGINIELHVRSSRQIATLISGGQVDIGFIDPPVPVAGLTAELFHLECVCIMPRNDPLFAREIVRPNCLADRSVVAITGEHTVDRQLDLVLSASNTIVKRQVASSYFAIARNIVASSDCVAIVDPINGKADLSDGVEWRPFYPRIDHDLAVITSSDQPLGKAAGSLLKEIRSRLQIEAGWGTSGIKFEEK